MLFCYYLLIPYCSYTIVHYLIIKIVFTSQPPPIHYHYPSPNKLFLILLILEYYREMKLII